MMRMAIVREASVGMDEDEAYRAQAVGYFALFCVVVSTGAALAFPRLEPIGLFAVVLIWICWPCGWLFGIIGLVRSRRGARVAAVLSLAILAAEVALMLLLSIPRH